MPARIWRRMLAGLIEVAVLPLAVLAWSAQAEPYDWRPVVTGGGGYITGLVAHPLEPDLIYARTDNGGVLRWDGSTNAWRNITKHWPASRESYYGIDGIAVDPNDADVVYIATGKSLGAKGHIFKSTDRGDSWKALKPFYFAGNGDLRWAGELIAVDPNNSDIVYAGTRKEGLHRTTDGGKTWTAMPGVPAGAEDIGIRTVTIDPTRTVGDRSQNIYAGVFGIGVYRSTDGGETWSLMPGSPAKPTRMQVARDGTVYVASASGVYKYGTSWTAISPAPYAFTALDVAKDDPGRIIVAADYYLSTDMTPFEVPIYLSNDGGRSWTEIVGKSDWSFEAPWYYSAKADRFSAATSDLQFDPFDPSRVYLSDWYQVMITDDIDAAGVHWRQRIKGHEQLSVQSMAALPAPNSGTGAVLYVGTADNRGFRRTGDDLDRFPSSWQNVSLDISGIDFSESDPNQMFQVGGVSEGGAAYSTDNGVSWTRTSWPFGANGRVAVSATDPRLVVVVPLDSAPKRTTDRGSTWSSTTGAPPGGITKFWSAQAPIASDRMDGDRFYYLVPNGDFYRSTDGGASWTKTTKIAVGNDYVMKAAPGIANEVWVAGAADGLFRSSDGGTSFKKLDTVESAILVGFGKNPPGKSNPTVFIYGRVKGEGVFRSDDMGATWEKISGRSNRLGINPKQLEGDRQVYGRVFIGTGGAGVWYGRPASAESSG